MGIEIEKKFFLHPNVNINTLINKSSNKKNITQGYLSTFPTVRVRTVEDELNVKKAYITIKGKRVGISTPEYEYEIPYNEAVEMLNMCDLKIIKTRYDLFVEQSKFEIDVFNTGLVLIEIELPNEDYPIPNVDFLGKDVSDDMEYTNVKLAKKLSI